MRDGCSHSRRRTLRTPITTALWWTLKTQRRTRTRTRKTKTRRAFHGRSWRRRQRTRTRSAGRWARTARTSGGAPKSAAAVVAEGAPRRSGGESSATCLCPSAGASLLRGRTRLDCRAQRRRAWTGSRCASIQQQQQHQCFVGLASNTAGELFLSYTHVSLSVCAQVRGAVQVGLCVMVSHAAVADRESRCWRHGGCSKCCRSRPVRHGLTCSSRAPFRIAGQAFVGMAGAARFAISLATLATEALEHAAAATMLQGTGASLAAQLALGIPYPSTQTTFTSENIDSTNSRLASALDTPLPKKLSDMTTAKVQDALPPHRCDCFALRTAACLRAAAPKESASGSYDPGPGPQGSVSHLCMASRTSLCRATSILPMRGERDLRHELTGRTSSWCRPASVMRAQKRKSDGCARGVWLEDHMVERPAGEREWGRDTGRCRPKKGAELRSGSRLGTAPRLGAWGLSVPIAGLPHSIS
eukprot:358307-Chlamydomonas_euryale.AAC.10